MTAFAPGTLWPRVEEVSRAALESGALRPIANTGFVVEDGGIAFFVRRADSLARRAVDAVQKPRSTNPFLPPEPALTVTSVSPTHLALLNKYNVVDHHLLIVTRAFVGQETPLDLSDVEALWRCLAEGPALGFYNSCREAGASQPHRHLQLVPLPLAGVEEGTPIDALVREGALPFPHAVARFEPDAAKAHAVLQELLGGISRSELGAAYNLLITSDWMLAVPRTHDAAEGVSFNALGFAGSIFVRDDEQLELVRKRGPVELLNAVCR